MDKQFEDVLWKLYCEAKKTRDMYLMNCNIGMNSDKRKEICHWLEDRGYISKYDAVGKTGVNCQVTEKTVQYFMNKTMEV